MKFYKLLLIFSLVSCLQVRPGLIRSWDPRHWGHHYQGDCYENCPEDRMTIRTYETYLGKYLGCLFLKAFDIIKPDFQPSDLMRATDRGFVKVDKIKAVKDDTSLLHKVVLKMLKYAQRDNCTTIDEVEKMLSEIFIKEAVLAFDSFGFGNRTALYLNSCIEKCALGKEKYLQCLFENAAQNLWLDYDHALQKKIRSEEITRDLFSNSPEKIKRFLNHSYLKIMDAVIYYNKIDLDSFREDKDKCFVISKNMDEFEKLFKKIFYERRALYE